VRLSSVRSLVMPSAGSSITTYGQSENGAAPCTRRDIFRLPGLGANETSAICTIGVARPERPVHAACQSGLGIQVGLAQIISGASQEQAV
jgi:hypothetical protein